MGFAIVVTARARRQIVGASAWWRMNRLAAPALLDEELERALVRLAENPGLGTRVPGARHQDVHRLVIRRVEYLVFYRVRPNAKRIEILAFWHASRGSEPLR